MTHVDLKLAKSLAQSPVTPGSAALDALIAAIDAGTEARERGTEPARAAIDLVRAARLGAFRLPRDQSGGGATLAELFRTVLRLAEADSNIPHILRNHFIFVEKALRVQDNPKYARWLDEVRAGRIFGLGASELGIQAIGNGDANTRVAARGDAFELNGRKYYSTGNFYADYIFVHASGPVGERVAAVVPVGRSGVDVTDDWDGIGQRLTASGTTVFDRVHVAPDELVVLAEEERKVPIDSTLPQLYLTTIIAGILRRVVRDAAEHLKQRDRNYYHAVDANPAADPLLEQAIGRLSAAAYVAEASVGTAAEALGRAFESVFSGEADPELFLDASLKAAQSKIVIDDLALHAATHLYDIGGASAAKQASRLDRHWRNIRTIASHNPVSYKALAVGRHVLHGTALPPAAFF
ncbi:hypothetical protein [Zavarzinia sp. CC-PAN008]|uniref:hypothetical protein n=1 Tax=Zavarzinia sp. CC-PAN008 TaxID=3243332 RepID=UPI003F7428D3